MNELLNSSIKIWNKLTEDERTYLIDNTIEINYKKNDIINNNSCVGLIIINKGTIRTYISSESGKEITLYKLIDNDICLFSASCAINNINFDVTLECTEDTNGLLLPIDKYKTFINKSNTFKDYMNDIISLRFSDTMWVLEQFVFHSLDKRLANYLLECDSDIINITHEEIANDLGSSREVISRMLKYFENENIVKLERNSITLVDYNKLMDISDK